MRSHYLELNVDSLMKDKKLEANLSMVASRVMAGLNMNGLKYLLPLWLGALTGVTIRCVFAAVAFWLTGCFIKEAAVTRKQRIMLFCLGAFGLYGFMFCYLLGISKTTPVSSAIFNSMQPIWVFLISVFFLHEKATVMKIIGIALGFGGAMLCILTQGSDDLARDAFIIVSSVAGWDAPMFAEAWKGEWHWTAWAVLAFILIFPTYLSYFLVPVGLKYLKTTVVAIYSYLILVVTTVVSLSLGQDRFSWTQAVAIAMICISVYFVEVAEGNSKKSDTPLPPQS